MNRKQKKGDGQPTIGGRAANPPTSKRGVCGAKKRSKKTKRGVKRGVKTEKRGVKSDYFLSLNILM